MFRREDFACPLEKLCGCRDIGVMHQVDREVGPAAGDGPHVKIVHAQHTRQAQQGLPDRRDVDAFGNSFLRDVQGVLEEHPGPRQNPQSDGHRDHRIDPVPAGDAHHDRASNHADPSSMSLHTSR